MSEAMFHFTSSAVRPPLSREELAIAKALGVPVTPVPRPGSHPDAELMAACAAFDAAEREYLNFFHGPDYIEDDDEREEAMEPCNEERSRLSRANLQPARHHLGRSPGTGARRDA
jgi:hypothetical protein